MFQLKTPSGGDRFGRRIKRKWLHENEPWSHRVKLRTWLLPGSTKSSERIKVIVTRQPVSLLKSRVAEGVFMEYKPSETALLIDLMRVLGTMDPADWAEATLPYEVRNSSLLIK